MKRIIIFLIAIFSFITINFNKSYTSPQSKDILKGRVVSIDKKENFIWVQTNLAQNIQTGKVLYIHNENGTPKIILKVTAIQPNHLKTVIIDGKLSDIKLGNSVNDVFNWDSYNYSVAVTYKIGSRLITVEDNLVIDNMIAITSKFGTKSTQINGQDITTMDMVYKYGKVRIKKINLKEGRSISAETTSISTISKFDDRKIHVKLPGVGPLEASAENIHKIKIIKKINGAKRILRLPYNTSQKISLSKDKKSYMVNFVFFNYELGKYAIENMISQENDKEKLKDLIDNLKMYHSSKIKSIGIAGSFNNWDASKNPLHKNKFGIYETVITLPKGSHQYYFVINYKGTKEIPLKILDPYSNRVIDINQTSKENIKESDDKEDSVEKEDKEDSTKEGEDDKEADKDDSKEDEDKEDSDVKKSNPGQEEDKSGDDKEDDEKENDEKSSGNKEDSNKEENNKSDSTSKKGINGKASLIELPSIQFGDTKSLIDENKKKLPFDPDALKVEESKVKSSVTTGKSVIVDGVRYYKVKFYFDQLYRVRIEMKKMINAEVSKEQPNNNLIANYKRILKTYSEAKVKKVSVVGTFNNWKANEYPLKKDLNGIWSGEHYIKEGKHFYKFAIDMKITGQKEIQVIDLKTTFYESPEGEKLSVMYIGVSPEKKEEEINKKSDKIAEDVKKPEKKDDDEKDEEDKDDDKKTNTKGLDKEEKEDDENEKEDSDTSNESAKIDVNKHNTSPNASNGMNELIK